MAKPPNKTAIRMYGLGSKLDIIYSSLSGARRTKARKDKKETKLQVAKVNTKGNCVPAAKTLKINVTKAPVPC